MWFFSGRAPRAHQQRYTAERSYLRYFLIFFLATVLALKGKEKFLIIIFEGQRLSKPNLMPVPSR